MGCSDEEAVRQQVLGVHRAGEKGESTTER